MTFKAYYREDIRNALDAALMAYDSAMTADDVTERDRIQRRGFSSALAVIARKFGVQAPIGALLAEGEPHAIPSV